MSITEIFILIFMSLFGGVTLYMLLVTWNWWYEHDSDNKKIKNGKDVGTLIGCILIILFFILR